MLPWKIHAILSKGGETGFKAHTIYYSNVCVNVEGEDWEAMHQNRKNDSFLVIELPKVLIFTSSSVFSVIQKVCITSVI